MNDSMRAFQDDYPDDYAHCYGCGRLNEKGLKIKSYWEGDETVCKITPQDYYSGGKKDILYGGLIASLIDCHAAGSAAAAKARELGVDTSSHGMPRFVTASLKVDYIAPTPLERELELRGSIKEIKGRKVIVLIDLKAGDTVCAKGEVVMIQIKETQ